MSAAHQDATSTVAHEAAGAIEAQRVVDGLRDGSITADVGWLRFLELSARFGRNSPALRAFMLELMKRLAQPIAP